MAALDAGGVVEAPKDRVEIVIENARRLQAIYRAAASGTATGARRIVVDAWKARASRDPGGVVSYIRDTFLVPTRTPLTTVLQSLGMLDGAHFPGCVKHR